MHRIDVILLDSIDLSQIRHVRSSSKMQECCDSLVFGLRRPRVGYSKRILEVGVTRIGLAGALRTRVGDLRLTQAPIFEIYIYIP